MTTVREIRKLYINKIYALIVMYFIYLYLFNKTKF